MRIQWLLALFFSLLDSIECGRTSLWYECDCRWGEWQEWWTCNSECNGRHSRARRVYYSVKSGCADDYHTCATDDLGFDYSRCNKFCYNGGTSDGYNCRCVRGFYGKCCGLQVNCGNPGSISYGNLHGGTYTYGRTVRYTCRSGYLLVGGSSSRRCQLSARWSGGKPRCAYYNSCSSGPCKNGGICTNIPDYYQCTCINGWSGKNCKIDIQPPVMENCASDKYINTSAIENLVKWQIPTFTDPHNFAIKVTSNYPSNEFIFPWGDFKVSYTAIKPTNGLSTNCLFSINLRPNPCPPINVPVNGALICNNWRTDYGQFCIFFCKESYTVPRGVMMDNVYVCGASGTWMPSNTVPDCSEVNCGNPGSISHGNVHGSTFTYGRTVRYTYHSGYMLVGGSSSRRCQLVARWSGRKPRCAYYNSCASVPCKNGATCTNIPDHYQCTCTHDWSGKYCDVDIQPPVMTNCSSNKSIATSALESLVKWQIPLFTDPHYNAIKVTSNYPSNEFIFPWGDFKVSYTAIKPLNGLSTNCLFSISLRPKPCPTINIPVNGALICNNWRTDYGQFCTFLCRESYTVPRGIMMDHFYVCGASGMWMPSNTIPNCSVTATNLHAARGYAIGPTYSNCTDDRREMQEYYIKKLSQSHFRQFCKKFQQECIPENVSVKC